MVSSIFEGRSDSLILSPEILRLGSGFWKIHSEIRFVRELIWDLIRTWENLRFDSKFNTANYRLYDSIRDLIQLIYVFKIPVVIRFDSFEILRLDSKIWYFLPIMRILRLANHMIRRSLLTYHMLMGSPWLTPNLYTLHWINYLLRSP